MPGKATAPAPQGKSNAPASTRSNPAQAANSVSLQPPRPNGVPPEDDIRARAFALWEQAGCPDCDGVEFWLRAEQELKNPR